jgi:hypothetical protein
LKFKKFDNFSIVFEPQKDFVVTFSTFKATKITQISFEMSKIRSFEVKGVIIWFKQRKPN